jgi:hypothetical protein
MEVLLPRYLDLLQDAAYWQEGVQMDSDRSIGRGVLDIAQDWIARSMIADSINSTSTLFDPGHSVAEGRRLDGIITSDSEFLRLTVDSLVFVKNRRPLLLSTFDDVDPDTFQSIVSTMDRTTLYKGPYAAYRGKLPDNRGHFIVMRAIEYGVQADRVDGFIRTVGSSHAARKSAVVKTYPGTVEVGRPYYRGAAYTKIAAVSVHRSYGYRRGGKHICVRNERRNTNRSLLGISGLEN